MKQITIFSYILLGGSMLLGCSSFGPGDREVTYTSTNSVVHAAFAQPRSATVLMIEGTNVEWTVKNATRICLSTPIAPIPLPVSHPGFWLTAFGTIERLAWPLAWLSKDTSGTYTPFPNIRGPVTINPAPAASTSP